MELEVLVVDDEEHMGRLIGRLLRRRANVTAVTSADEALSTLEKRDYDAILCDLHMPAVSGVQLYNELVEANPGSEDRIVFLTGGLYPEDDHEFFESIDNPLVLKPFQVQELEDAIDEVIAMA